MLPATYMRLDTPDVVGTLSWEADVQFSAYPATEIRRIADLVLEQPSLPRLALLVRSEPSGSSTLTVQYPGGAGDVYDEKPMSKKLVPNQSQHVRLAYEAGDGGALRGVLTIDGVVVVDTALPNKFVPSKMTVYQGSSYQTAQESWSSRYDNTVIRFAP